MSDTAQTQNNQNIPFPDPPVANVQAPSPAQPSIDSIIAQSLISDDIPTQSTPPSSFVGSPNKEAPVTRPTSEVTHMVELNEAEPLPEEVEGWLQKLDQAGEIKLPEPITHDGDVLLANSEAQVVKEKIVLPMSQANVQQGVHAKVTESARWLAEWCVKLIKSMKNEVKYAPETTVSSENVNGKI